MFSKENRKWLDYTIDLYSEKIDSVLKSYFDENKISSGLTPIELSNVSCTLISKLLDTPDCVNKEHRVLKYREIFKILTEEIFDLCEFEENDRIVECYRIMEYFYKNEKKTHSLKPFN